jgi:hypothetical protein
MTETRVDRLLRRAEEAAEAGDTDKSDQFLAVLAPAIYVQRLEVKALKKALTP